MSMRPDFARAAADYAAFRPPFDVRVFERLSALGVGLPGQVVLDVGAGTGLLGAGFRARGAGVVEVDPSIELLRAGNGRHCVAARAEALPFADGAFDAVTAGQSWHWFDRRVAPREIGRVLRRGGAVAVVYQTYLPLPGEVADASERVILRFRPRWRHAGGVGVNGQALRDLQLAGFGGIESFTFDVGVRYTRARWRGFVRTCSAVGPTLSADELARFEAEHAAALGGFPAAFDVPHRVFVAVGRRA